MMEPGFLGLHLEEHRGDVSGERSSQRLAWRQGKAWRHGSDPLRGLYGVTLQWERRGTLMDEVKHC